MSPYLHIGADEIRIPNGKQFADRMAAKVKSLGRQPIQWAGNNDLPVSGDSYAQLWNDENSVGLPDPARQKNPYFDSTAGYVNSFDPGILVRRNFFRQPCGTARGNNHSLGVIQCLWPDTRVENKKTFLSRAPSGLPCSPWRNAVGKEFQRMVPVCRQSAGKEHGGLSGLLSV